MVHSYANVETVSNTRELNIL